MSAQLQHRCSGLLSSVRHLLDTEPTSLDEAAPLVLLWHLHAFWLTTLRTLWPGGSGGKPSSLSLRALEAAWQRSVDRRARACFGDCAGVDAPTHNSKAAKGVCGPLITPLLAEIEAAIRKRSGGGGKGAAAAGSSAEAIPLDFVDALSGAKMVEWHQRWLNSLLRQHVVEKDREERVGLLMQTSGALYAAWAAQMHQADTKHAASSNSSSLAADLADFRALVPPTGAVWVSLYDAIHRSLKQATGRSGNAFTIAAQQQLGTKHKIALAKMEMAVMAMAQEASSSSSGAASSSGAGKGNAGAGRQQRTCKYPDCADRFIAADSKFASLHCTAGCVQSMHTHCWPVYSAEHEDEVADADTDDGPPVLPCPGRDCEGALHRVLLRQAGKTLAVLLEPDAEEEEHHQPPAAGAAATNSSAAAADESSSSSSSAAAAGGASNGHSVSGIGDDDDDDEDNNDDEEEQDASAAADGSSAAAMLLDPSLRENLSRRQCRQIRAFNIAKDNDRRNVSKRFEVNESGQLVFSSTQNRIDRLKAKKARTANQIEARKRKEADEQNRAEKLQQQEASAATTPSAAAAASGASKPFMFEVVVKKPSSSPNSAASTPPLAPRPAPAAAVAAAAAAAPLPAAHTAATPPSSKKNIFSSLNLDDDEHHHHSQQQRPSSTTNGVPTYLTRNAWDDGYHPHVAPAWSQQQQQREHDPEVVPRDRVADIQIKVKKSKGSRTGVSGKLARGGAGGGGANEAEDEEQQLKRAMAASLGDARPAGAVTTASPAHMPSPAPGGPDIPSLNGSGGGGGGGGGHSSPATTRLTPKLARAEGEPADGSVKGASSPVIGAASAAHPPPVAALPMPAAKPVAMKMATAPLAPKAMMMMKPTIAPSPFAMRPFVPVMPPPATAAAAAAAPSQPAPVAARMMQPQPLLQQQQSLMRPVFVAPPPLVPVAAVAVPRAVSMVPPAAAASQSMMLRTFPAAAAPAPSASPLRSAAAAYVPGAPSPVRTNVAAPPTFRLPPPPPPAVTAAQLTAAPAPFPAAPAAAAAAPPKSAPAPTSIVAPAPPPAPSPVAAPAPVTAPVPVPTVVPAPAPSAASPVAQPGPAPPSFAGAGGGLQVCDSILAAEAGQHTNVLLLSHLPPSLTVSSLGNEFCVFGRLAVKMLLTISGGVSACLQFQSVEAATAALESMRGRQYLIELPGAAQPQAWTLQHIVFAATPVRVIPPPQVAVRTLPKQ